MTKNTKTLEISQELYDALIHLKGVFEEMTGEEINDETEVIGILISGFVESLMEESQSKDIKGGKKKNK